MDSLHWDPIFDKIIWHFYLFYAICHFHTCFAKIDIYLLYFFFNFFLSENCKMHIWNWQTIAMCYFRLIMTWDRCEESKEGRKINDLWEKIFRQSITYFCNALYTCMHWFFGSYKLFHSFKFKNDKKIKILNRMYLQD